MNACTHTRKPLHSIAYVDIWLVSLSLYELQLMFLRNRGKHTKWVQIYICEIFKLGNRDLSPMKHFINKRISHKQPANFIKIVYILSLLWYTRNINQFYFIFKNPCVHHLLQNNRRRFLKSNLQEILNCKRFTCTRGSKCSTFGQCVKYS